MYREEHTARAHTGPAISGTPLPSRRQRAQQHPLQRTGLLGSLLPHYNSTVTQVSKNRAE